MSQQVVSTGAEAAGDMSGVVPSADTAGVVDAADMVGVGVQLWRGFGGLCAEVRSSETKSTK